jgi:mono/diheme cytochrome c family protein
VSTEPVRGGRLLLLGVSLASALCGASTPPVSAAGAAAPVPLDDPYLKNGRAIYLAHCAACHGERAQGDGASAAGFATKPSNLADGRLMNPLPDEFLENIIRRGGPAEGLSPGMPAFAQYLGETQIRDVIAYVRSLASPPFEPRTVPALVTVPGAPHQPIFFSHLIHAGKYQIACQHCHADARRSEYAGLPSVERCMGCHKIIGAQDNPEIGKIHDYWRRRQPIPWVRIFKLPEFTYFPHKAHVRAGLECGTCHGPIERMRRVGGPTGPSLVNDLLNLVGLKPGPRPLTMGWCVDCHRRENVRPGVKAPLECVTCHH